MASKATTSKPALTAFWACGPKCPDCGESWSHALNGESRKPKDCMMGTSQDSIDGGSNMFDQPRHNWTRSEAQALYDLPFADLIFRAQGIHRRNFDPNHVETASLLSIKTGGCPEDCGYCAQSAHYDAGVQATRLMDQAAGVDTAE